MTAHNSPQDPIRESGTQPIVMPGRPPVRAAQQRLARPPRLPHGAGSTTSPTTHPRELAFRLAEPKPVGRAGQVLSGRYRLIDQLGTGAMGEVYRALDLQRKWHCAIKLISPDAPASLQAHQRFMNEAQIVSRLSHPNIIEVHEFNEDRDRTPYLVMELLDGEDLQALVNRSGRLSLDYTLRILSEVGAGLHYAHELGVVHRDIKPNNIYLCQQKSPAAKNQVLAKILDFGLAKMVSDGDNSSGAWSMGQPQLTRGIVVGTPAYMPPETLLGESETVDPRSDQWALAVIAYEMLSGQLPFDHEDHQDPLRICRLICAEDPIPLRVLTPGLPPHVYYAIEVAMSKKREHRFSSIGDFLRTLANQPLRGRPPLGGTATLPSASSGSTTPSPSQQDARSAPQESWCKKAELESKPLRNAVAAASVHSRELRTVEYSAAELQALTQQSREAPKSAEAAPKQAAPAMPPASAPIDASPPLIRDCRETLLFDRSIEPDQGATLIDCRLPGGSLQGGAAWATETDTHAFSYFLRWGIFAGALLGAVLLIGNSVLRGHYNRGVNQNSAPTEVAAHAVSEAPNSNGFERRLPAPIIVIPLQPGTGLESSNPAYLKGSAADANQLAIGSRHVQPGTPRPASLLSAARSGPLPGAGRPGSLPGAARPALPAHPGLKVGSAGTGPVRPPARGPLPMRTTPLPLSVGSAQAKLGG